MKVKYHVVRPVDAGRVISLALISDAVPPRAVVGVTVRPSEPTLVARVLVTDAEWWGPFTVRSGEVTFGEGVRAVELRDRRSESWVRPAVDPGSSLTLRTENVNGEPRTLAVCCFGYPFDLSAVGPPHRNRAEALDQYHRLRARGEEAFLYVRSEGYETVARGEI